MRGQIKMFETTGVLVVFFAMLAGGAVFYFNIQESAIEKELAQQARLRGMQVAQRALFLPELECSYMGVPEQNCIDRYRIKAFANVQDTKLQEALFGLFGDATLNISIAWPQEDFSATIYDRQPEKYTGRLAYQFPVLVKDPVTGTAAFGVMEVNTYASK
jgi:hypothetical protein